MNEKKTKQKDIAMKTSIKSIMLNVLLIFLKLVAGIMSNSSAMISDAVHTASDVLVTIVVIIGVSISAKAPDDSHPYGHERFESIAAILLSIMLLVTGIGIGYSAIKQIIAGISGDLQEPGVFALVAAIISILVKEFMYRFTKKSATEIKSDALLADAWHHRSDALASIGSLIGIAGARLGLPILDPIAGLVISIMVIKVAINIFKDALSKVTDSACSPEMIAQMKEVILSQEGVEKIDLLKTRKHGAQSFVDLEISVDGTKSLLEAHYIATKVHDAIEATFEDVIHCMVHVNPSTEKD